MIADAPRSTLADDRALLITLCLTSALSVLNALALSPFLAKIAPELGTSVALLGQALMASALVGACLGLVIGPSAEWLGYRSLLVAGVLTLIVCNLGTALAPSFPMLVLAQLLGGVSAATISPMAFAIAGLRYHGDERRKVISRMFASASGASIIGFPVLTFVGSNASWRWSFVVLAVTAAVGLLLAITTIPRDTAAPTEPLRIGALLGVYRPLMTHPPVTLVYTAQFLRGVTWTGMLAYIGAFLVDELGRSVQDAGLIWLVLGPGFLTGSLLVSGWLRRFNPRRTFTLTAPLMGLLVALVFLVQPPLLVVWAMLLGAAFFGGIAEVTAVTIMSAETPTSQGATMALNSSATRFGTACGALVGGALLATGGYSALGVGFPIIAIAAALTARFSGRVAGSPDVGIGLGTHPSTD
jgi:predicted MFS family arabinose efflux permease